MGSSYTRGSLDWILGKTDCLGNWLNHRPLKFSKICGCGTWGRGLGVNKGSSGLMVRLHLRGLVQHLQFYDSIVQRLFRERGLAYGVP